MSLRNNAGDIEDLDFPEVGSEIPEDDDEESISLGYNDCNSDDGHQYRRTTDSFELDENAETLIKPLQPSYSLFTGGGYGKGKPLNNSFTGPYNNMDHIHVDRGANTQFE